MLLLKRTLDILGRCSCFLSVCSSVFPYTCVRDMNLTIWDEGEKFSCYFGSNTGAGAVTGEV